MILTLSFIIRYESSYYVDRYEQILRYQCRRFAITMQMNQENFRFAPRASEAFRILGRMKFTTRNCSLLLQTLNDPLARASPVRRESVGLLRGVARTQRPHKPLSGRGLGVTLKWSPAAYSSHDSR